VFIVDSEEKKVYDTLGMEIKTSSYNMVTKKSIFIIFASYIESNPALAMTSILLVLIFLYIMALYEKLVLFNYLGIISSIIFMFWVSFSDDARTGFKLVSVGVIFMVLIIFMSI
jgi:membrane-bound ClpP family serine protease